MLLLLFLAVQVLLLLLLQLQRFEVSVDRLDLELGIGFVVLDLCGLLVQVFDLVVLPLLDNTDLILVLLVLGVVVLDDLVADCLLDIDLLLEVGNLIGELRLFHLLLALHAGDGTRYNALHVLHLELRFRLRLVDILLELGDVLDTLLGLSREFLIVLL